MSDHIYTTLTFYWYEHGSESALRLHYKTLEEGKAIAKDFGWRPKCWYQPSTWRNRMLTTYLI